MSNFVRALLLSAVATGVAAAVVNTMQKKRKNSVLKGATDSKEVNTDSMTEEEIQLLSDELEAML